MKRAIKRASLSVAMLLALTASSVQAAEKLTLYCTAQIEWCQLIIEAFQKESGIEVAMIRKSTGETFAQIKAEASNPKGDVWWGGTGDPHLQAAEEGLTVVYESPMLGELHDWAVMQHEAAGGRTVGIYSSALSFGYNTELLAERGLPEPKCWADLIEPEYKSEVQMANPNSSGTAYTTLATMVQLFGEEEGFEFMKKLHRHINQYTKSGSAPIKAAARGETTIGIAFQHDAVAQVANGFPIRVVAPCEGTGYEIGSMSVIAGARNPESARVFYDFALRADVQSRAKEAKVYYALSNKGATAPPEADFSHVKLIDYDFKKYGSSAERQRLLKKWDEEVYSLPR